MDNDNGQGVTRSISLLLLILATLVAIAAIVLIVLDTTHTAMYFTLVGALIAIFLNAKNLRRSQPGR